MSLTQRLRVTGSRLSDPRVHRRPCEDAGQSVPLFARQRIQLRRRLQTTGEPPPLYLEVFCRIVVLLVLVRRPVFVVSFRLAIIPILVVFVPATGTAAPSCSGHCNLPINHLRKSLLDWSGAPDEAR